MTAPVISLPADATLATAAALLAERKISAVPVLEGERLVGVFSTTDLVAAGPDALSEPLEKRMTKHVRVVGPDETIDQAARRLLEARVHRLVVTDGERVVGVLSARDLLVDVKQRRVPTRISQLMTPDVVTVEVGDSVDLAIARLVSAGVRGLVVVDGGFPVGVFTQAEALSVRTAPPSIQHGPVERVMSYETICLDADTTAHRAAAYAMSMNVRRLLVVSHRDLVGVLAVMDLLRPLTQ